MTTTDKPKPRGLRRVVRVAVRLLVVLVVLLCVVRLSHPLWLPGVVQRAGASAGLDIRYGELDLRLFAGDVELRDLVVGVKAEDDTTRALADVDYLAVDVGMRALLAGELRLRRVSVGRAELHLERNAQGEWNLPAGGDDEPDEPDADEPSGPADFRLPLVIDRFDLAALRLSVDDALEERHLFLEAAVEAIDIGHLQEPGQLRVDMRAPGLFSDLRLAADMRLPATEFGDARALELDLEGHLVDLDPEAVALWVPGLAATARELDGDVVGDVRLAPTDLLGSARVDVRIQELAASALGQGGPTESKLGVLRLGYAWGPAATRVGPVQLDGLTFEVGRNRAGHFQALGFEVLGGGPAAAPQAASAASPEPAAPSAPLELDDIEIVNTTLRFRDELMGTELEFELERLAVQPQANGPLRFQARMHTPGVFQTLLLDGELKLAHALGEANRLTGTVRIEGIDPTALAPYLAASGIAWDAQRVTFDLGFDATLVQLPQGGLALDLELRGQTPEGERLAGLELLAVRGLVVAPNGDIAVDELLIDGPALFVERAAEGGLRIGGLRIGGAEPAQDATSVAAEVTPDAAAPSNAAPGPAPPRIQVGRVALTNTQLGFVDRTVTPALELTPEVFELVLTDLDLFGPETASAPFELRFEQPGLLGELVAKGAVRSQRPAPGAAPSIVAFDLALTGRGLTTAPLADQLAAAGIEGALTDGELDLDVAGQVDLDAGPSFDVTVTKLSARAGAAELVGLDGLVAQGVRATADGLELPLIEMRAPRIALTRDAQGQLGIGGLVFGTPPPGEPEGPTRFEPAPTTPAPTAEPAPAPAIRIAGLDLTGAELVLDDVALAEPLIVQLDARLGALDLAAPADTELALELRAPGRFATAALDLVLLPDVTAPSARGRLDVSGIQGAGFAGLLPAGVDITLTDGAFGFQLDAAAELAGGDDGTGKGFELALTELALAEAGAALFEVERLAVRVPTISDSELHIAELALVGIRLDAQQRADGSLVLPGVALGPRPAPLAEPPVEAVPEPAETSTPVAPSQPWRPRVMIDAVRVELAHLGWQGPGDATPLDLGFTLANTAPYTHDPYAEQTDEVRPLRLELDARVTPLAERAFLALDIDPFAADPHLAAKLELSGVSGPELERALPALAEALDASDVTSGALEATLDAGLQVRRRGPLDFDFASGIGGDFELSDVNWRPTAESAPRLGLRRLSGVLTRANSRGMTWSTIEIDRPLGRLTFTDAGLRVGGLVVRNAADQVAAEVTDPIADEQSEPQWAAAEPAAVPAPSDSAVANEQGAEDAPVADPTPSTAAASAQPSTTAPAPTLPVEPYRIEVRDLYLSDADIIVRDERVTPPMVLPINDLEIEVRGFSTAAAERQEPIAFNVFVGASTIELPERTEASNVVSGLLGAVGGAVGDVIGVGDDTDKVQQRRAFSGLDIAGRVTPGEQPTGWTSIELVGLELANYSGLVGQSAVELNDGLLDLTVDLRLLGERGTSVSLVARAEHLSLSEPIGGPISSYLKLPAPLDTVLYLLRNEDGAQVIPLSFRIKPGGGAEGLLTAVSTTLGKLIGEAIASSPMRFVGGVLEFNPFQDDEQIELPDELYFVGFRPGSPEPADRPLLETLAPIIDLLRADDTVKVDLVHVFSAADLTALSQVTSPDRDSAIELVERLRNERDALIERRDLLAVELLTDYALGMETDREAKHGRLANLDAEVALVEDSLDGILEFLRPGSDRRAERRVRAAGLLVAEARLEMVRKAVRDLAIRSIGERIRVRRARFSEQVEDAAGGRVYALPRR